MVEVKNENVLIRFQLWHVPSVCSAKKNSHYKSLEALLKYSFCLLVGVLQRFFFLPVDEAIKAMPAVDE